MSQLTIQISEKGGALIAQLQKEIFQRRRKKVSAEGVIETLIESGAKSQSDKRFATSWKNLIADIEKAAKVAQTHGAKPANLSDAEWALVLAHRTRSGGGDANKPKARASASRSKTTTPKAAAKPRSARSAAPKADSSAVAVASKPARAKATPSRAKAATTTTKARASSRAKPPAAPVPATEVPEVSTAALGSTPAPAAPLSAATTRRTRTRSTAITGAKPRTNTSPAARRMAKAVTRLGMGSSASKAAAPKASPAVPTPISYPSTDNGSAAGPDRPAE
ncbi:MAG: hypothetical protein NT158_05200 [Cyanobacteria bacterium]|nr:hypothetical protein [Cyanobacteriota bacterium]